MAKALGARCDQCPLLPQPVVPSWRGENLPKLIIVGEAPGYQEVEQGRPFVGPSGQLIHFLLNKVDVGPGDVFKTNAVLCRPPQNDDPSAHAIGCCYPRLKLELEQFPDVPILALGKAAMVDLDVTTRNAWVGRVIGTWHPAYVLRTPDAIRELYQAVWKVTHTPIGGEPAIDPQVMVVVSRTNLEYALASLLAAPAETLIFDLETDQTDWQCYKILCAGLTTRGDAGIVIPGPLLYEHGTAEILQRFFDDWAKAKRRLGGHNIKFDQNFLESHLGIKMRPTFDTMLAHYCLKETQGGHGLKELCAYHFDAPDYEGEFVQRHLKSRNDLYSKVPAPDLYKYNAYDVCYNYKLVDVLETEVRKEGLWDLYQYLLRASQALHRMELRGIQIDDAHLERVGEELTEQLKAHTTELRRLSGLSGLNPGSVKQLSEAMYGKLKLPVVKRTPKGAPSTDDDVLTELKGNPFVDELRAFRKKSKLQSSYVENLLEALDETGRVHPEYLLHGTEIGRLSARNPALQTIPRSGDPRDPLSSLGGLIRRAFISRPGTRLVVADYSQAELRVAAALSGDPFLLEAYRTGRDIHSEFARALFGEGYSKEQRAHCKMTVFSFLYGGSEFSMAKEEGMPMAEARKLVLGLKANMPRLTEYRDEMFQLLRKQGYVSTRTGRRRRFPLLVDSNVAEARKSAMHMPIAGGASDCTLNALIEAELEKGIPCVLTVHDSIIAEGGEAEGAALQEIMLRWASLLYPEVPWKVDVDIVDRWGEDE